MLLSAGAVSLLDPAILGWLQDPQLAQDSKAGECTYGLQEQLTRQGLQAQPAVKAAGPLERLHQQLQACLPLATSLIEQLQDKVPAEVIRTEMQVRLMLCLSEVNVAQLVHSCFAVSAGSWHSHEPWSVPPPATPIACPAIM